MSALAEPATFVPLSDGVISENTLSAKAPWGPSASRAPPSANCHHHPPAKPHDLPTTLAEVLPHTRFVFPNAPRQRATVYKRSVMRQWFDDWHLRPELSGDVVDCRYDEGLQTSGLGDTVRYLHELIAKEAALVGGVRNVVLGGMSQGCAASLIAALLWEGDDRLGAVVGMCGWLPYLTQMQEAMHVREDSAGETSGKAEDLEFFERSASPLASPTPAVTGKVDVAVSWLRDELEMPKYQGGEFSNARCKGIPIMLCHGRDDKKVDCYQSRAAADFLLSVGMEVRHWRLYNGVDHEFSGEMLADILAFLLTLPC
ncbi:hypothetical protein VPNG_02507 [Cytospora leucostoma]|uniref:Phospholipase/carboxylesterase/thioesterase domain-containing protein n=1 Tax=Cytospora leucostoma TaxID=1230097 RepID=A0A423XI83_9PEZI|nr:hypothetical protein VPNG_02507 [Cytospora leucostoma]